MLEESICHFRGVGLFCRFYSTVVENPLSFYPLWTFNYSVCIPIFVKWLSDTEPLPHIPGAGRVCSVLHAHAQFCRFDKADATADVQWHCKHRPPLWYYYFPVQSSLGADILVYWIGKIVGSWFLITEDEFHFQSGRILKIKTHLHIIIIMMLRIPIKVYWWIGSIFPKHGLLSTDSRSRIVLQVLFMTVETCRNIDNCFRNKHVELKFRFVAVEQAVRHHWSILINTV